MLYLAGQISLSLLAAALVGGMVGWTLRGDVNRARHALVKEDVRQ